MDPAHSSPPQSRLDQLEGRLQQFEAQLASNAAEARQTASALERALTSVATQPYTFASEAAKVAFTINYLTGRACLWERGTPACSSFQTFSAELRKVFGPVSLGPEATGELLNVKQGSRPVADYAIDFRTWARLSDWNQGVLSSPRRSVMLFLV
ncbi:hypothetical protein D4764_12G0010540 [Takifugu flavidus]|uniref:Retrotransposon gag domain-containing protein n=1 Tax=Takifugu flavidus TaxID=433684 RepID=A0A5C6PCY9_9TELE|nr:hypothetical protein D4764_12G0010540 [Takifugu flavidus]